VRTLLSSPPKGGSKSKLVTLWIKINSNGMNSDTKFVCVKTSSGKVVAEPFPHLTGVYIVGGKSNP